MSPWVGGEFTNICLFMIPLAILGTYGVYKSCAVAVLRTLSVQRVELVFEDYLNKLAGSEAQVDAMLRDKPHRVSPVRWPPVSTPDAVAERERFILSYHGPSIPLLIGPPLDDLANADAPCAEQVAQIMSDETFLREQYWVGVLSASQKEIESGTALPRDCKVAVWFSKRPERRDVAASELKGMFHAYVLRRSLSAHGTLLTASEANSLTNFVDAVFPSLLSSCQERNWIVKSVLFSNETEGSIVVEKKEGDGIETASFSARVGSIVR